jgi:hypothetical protein
MNRTLPGIWIDRSDNHWNATDSMPFHSIPFDSIQFHHECDPNELNDSDLQREKRKDPRIPRFRGISIHWSGEYWNASDSIPFDSPMQLIQTKLTKIIHHTVPEIDSETIHDFS